MIIGIFEEKHFESLSQQRLKGLTNLIDPDKKFESEEDLIISIQNTVGLSNKLGCFCICLLSAA